MWIGFLSASITSWILAFLPARVIPMHCFFSNLSRFPSTFGSALGRSGFLFFCTCTWLVCFDTGAVNTDTLHICGCCQSLKNLLEYPGLWPLYESLVHGLPGTIRFAEVEIVVKTVIIKTILLTLIKTGFSSLEYGKNFSMASARIKTAPYIGVSKKIPSFLNPLKRGLIENCLSKYTP